MNLFFANDSEADQLTKQNSGIWLKLLREHPPDKWHIIPFPDNQDGCAYFEPPLRDEAIQIKLRYSSGVYAVKETWRIWYKLLKDGGNEIQYKADFTKDDLRVFKGTNYSKWYSPTTMPAEAIRWTVKVVTTVVQQDNGLWYEQYSWEKVEVDNDTDRIIFKSH